jgi:hypothetical protein
MLLRDATYDISTTFLSSETPLLVAGTNSTQPITEKTMIRSLRLSAALLFIALLICAGSVSARTGGTFVPTPGSAIQINAVTWAVNQSQILTFLASSVYTGGGDGNEDNDNGNGKDKDKDKKKDKDDNGPDPTPEPSTMLSFGAALVIGGGVLYSLRLRRNRK